MSENLQSYSAKSEVSNLIKRRTRFERIKIAFSKAPIPVVMAIRETSIIFAFVIGILFLKEKMTMAKTIGTILAVSGIIVLRSF